MRTNRHPAATYWTVQLNIRISQAALEFLSRMSNATDMTCDQLASLYLQEHCMQEEAIQTRMTADLCANGGPLTVPPPEQGAADPAPFDIQG